MRLGVEESVKALLLTGLINTKRAGLATLHAGPALSTSSSKRMPGYFLKKISRKVPVISFLNSSSDGLSMKIKLGATFSASLMGGNTPG